LRHSTRLCLAGIYLNGQLVARGILESLYG